MGAPAVAEYSLSPRDVEHIRELTDSFDGELRHVDDGRFLARIAVWSHELPRDLRAFLEDFRIAERSPACLVRGYPVDDDRIGPSPEVSGARRMKSADETRLELAAILLGSCLGDVFGWRLQHDGRIVHDLAPRREHEDSGFGTGSRQYINWHTEDSFHPCRADYIGLFCVRNPAEVATTIGFLDIRMLSARDRQVLSRPVFVFRPDPSYLIAGADPLPGPDQGSILYGDPADPYLRFDQDYVDWPGDVAGIEEAIESLRSAVNVNLVHLPLRSGDFLLLDNRRAVHGRVSFEPEYGGADRWLKRINVTLDIKRSRHLRRSAIDRVIHV